MQTEAGRGWQAAGSRWERQAQCRLGVGPPEHWPEARQSRTRSTSTSAQPGRSQISWGFRPGTHRRAQGPGQLCTFGAKQEAAKEESSGAMGVGEMLPATAGSSRSIFNFLSLSCTQGSGPLALGPDWVSGLTFWLNGPGNPTRLKQSRSPKHLALGACQAKITLDRTTGEPGST